MRYETERTQVKAPHQEPWMAATIAFLNEHGAYRLGSPHRRVGNKTRSTRGDILFLVMRQLRKDGFRIERPAQIRDKHVAHLIRSWEKAGLSASTLQSRASVLRWVAHASGKPGMVQSAARYMESPELAVRRTSAAHDRSWSGAGVDVRETIAQIRAEYPRDALVLEMQVTFGLRMEEALCLKPREAVRVDKLYIVDGTKGGRQRVVLIETPEQKDLAERVCQAVSTQHEPLGGTKRTLAASKARYYRIMHKFGLSKAALGVTGHGLRTQYANDRYRALSGEASPVQGGSAIDYEYEMKVRSLLTAELGHSRITITTAYTGSFAMMRKTQQQNIVNAMQILREHLSWLRDEATRLGLTDIRLIGQRVLGTPAPSIAPVELMASGQGVDDYAAYQLAREAGRRVGTDVLIKVRELMLEKDLEFWTSRSLPLYWPDDMESMCESDESSQEEILPPRQGMLQRHESFAVKQLNNAVINDC